MDFYNTANIYKAGMLVTSIRVNQVKSLSNSVVQWRQPAETSAVKNKKYLENKNIWKTFWAI